MSSQDPSDLITQGRRCYDRGDFRGAIARYEEAATLAHARREHSDELRALSSLTVSWGSFSNPRKAIEVATHLLVRARELDREDYQMNASIRLAEAFAKFDLRGRWRELKPLLLDGLETARRLGEHWWEAYHLRWLGECAVRIGEEEQGLTWLQELLNMLQPDITNDLYHFRGMAYAWLSTLMCQRGDLAEALRYAEISVGAFHEYGNPFFTTYGQLILVRAKQAREERIEALQLVQEVLPQAQQMGWKQREQLAEYLRAELERDLGHPDVAENAARQALTLAQEIMYKEEEVKCLLILGQVLIILKRPEEAREMLKQARQLSQEREYEDHFYTAEDLLRGA